MPIPNRQAWALAIIALTIGLSHDAMAQDKKTLLVAEPGHGTASLPFYVAIRKGFFAEEGLDVKMLTVDGGSTHTNAVLSGQAYAFIGGPEHNAFAKLKGADLRAVVNLNDRVTCYLVARKGQGPAAGQPMPVYMKGKAIAVSLFGGTPNSILRYMLGKWRLDPKTDVTINEMASSVVIGSVKSGGSTVGVAPEPFVTQDCGTASGTSPSSTSQRSWGPMLIRLSMSGSLRSRRSPTRSASLSKASFAD